MTEHILGHFNKFEHPMNILISAHPTVTSNDHEMPKCSIISYTVKSGNFRSSFIFLLNLATAKIKTREYT